MSDALLSTLPPEGPVVEIRKLWSAFGTPQGRMVVHKDLDLTVNRG